MLSAGVGLAGVLSGFTKNAANFNSFLFGSIVAISDAELYSVAAVSLLVLLASVLLYKELFSIALDERAARLSGVPVNVVSTILPCSPQSRSRSPRERSVRSSYRA